MVTAKRLTIGREIRRNENGSGVFRPVANHAAKLEKGHPDMTGLATGLDLAKKGVGPAVDMHPRNEIDAIVRPSHLRLYFQLLKCWNLL